VSVSVAYAADAIQNTSLTISQTSGGKPTRFTFSTSVAAPLDGLALEYPPGFDLKQIKVDAVTLQGLKRTPVHVSQKVEGQNVVLAFSPSIATGSTLRVQIFDVRLPLKGGQYDLQVQTESGGVKGKTSTPPFTFQTVTASEALASWLAEQQWVQAWDSVGFLNIFVEPSMIVRAVPLLFGGWLMSIALVVVAFPFAIVGGLGLSFMKMSKLWPVRFIANVYINIVRGTPLFLQIFIAFVGLPIAGVRAPLFPTGVAVLALNSSAYLAEIFRAGIQSINKGQFEAAASLGMTYPQAMAFVIIPQTVKRVLPTMTSEFILLFKDTALLSAVGVFELMLYSNSLATNSGNLTPFVVAAVYYLIVTIPLINWVGSLERRLAVSEGGQVQEPEGRKRRGLFQWRPASAGPIQEFEASCAEHESR
jgi:polar amino acid transport system substrate-binding protein